MSTRSRFYEGLTRLVDRATVMARGEDREQSYVRDDLEQGRVMAARTRAVALVERMPESPSALALWAETADACGLDDEATDALKRLASRVPWRHEVWLEVARREGLPQSEATQSALARSIEGDDAAIRRQGALLLAHADLAQGQPHRAHQWLQRVPEHPTQPDPDLMCMRARCLLAMGYVAQARALAQMLPERPTHGAQSLLLAQLADREHDTVQAVQHGLRALLVEQPGAEDLVLTMLLAGMQEHLSERVIHVIRDAGLHEAPWWRAAFAWREADHDKLLLNVSKGLAAPKPNPTTPLVDWLFRQGALDVLAAPQVRPQLTPLQARGLELAESCVRDPAPTLERLAQQHSDLPEGWDTVVVYRAAQQLVPETSACQRADLLERIDSLERAMQSLVSHDDDDIESAPTKVRDRFNNLVAMASGCLHVAVLGEFSVGKTTLMNAWLGKDLGPTGITPTTAYPTWTSFAPDDSVTIEIDDGPNRVLTHDAFTAQIGAISSQSDIRKIQVRANRPALRSVVWVDTPGFNAGRPEHDERSLDLLESVDIVLWLTHAATPLKDTERRVLETIAKAGIPFQLIINKADQLQDKDRTEVQAYVRDELERLSLHSVTPAFLMSGRTALGSVQPSSAPLPAPQSGDVDDWQRFEGSVLRSDNLIYRERGLRRRLHRIVSDMLCLLKKETTEQQAFEGTAAARFRQRCHTDSAGLVDECLRKLQPHLQSLRNDLEPLRGDHGNTNDDTADYVLERTITRLHAPLCLDLATQAGDAQSLVVDKAANLVFGMLASCCSKGHKPLSATDLREPLQAIIRRLGQQIPDPRHLKASRLEALQRECEALADALQQPCRL